MRLLLLLSALGLVACAGADATPMVRAQAASDLVCAESTIRVVQSLDGSYRAIGCGKHKSYTAICEGTRCAVSRVGEPAISPQRRDPGADMSPFSPDR